MTIKTFIEQAHNLRCAGKTKAATKLYHQLLSSPDLKDQIEALNGIALCDKMNHHYRKAISGFKQAARLATKSKYFIRLSGLYRDIAITYEYQNNFRRADFWYDQALANLRQYGDKPLSKSPFFGITIGKKGLLYLHAGKLTTAEKLLTQGLKACQVSEADFYVLTLKMHLAELKLRQQNYAAVLKLTIPLIKEAKAKQWWHRLAQIATLQHKAHVYRQQKTAARQDQIIFEQAMAKLDSPELKQILKQDWHKEQLID